MIITLWLDNENCFFITIRNGNHLIPKKIDQRFGYTIGQFTEMNKFIDELDEKDILEKSTSPLDKGERYPGLIKQIDCPQLTYLKDLFLLMIDNGTVNRYDRLIIKAESFDIATGKIKPSDYFGEEYKKISRKNPGEIPFAKFKEAYLKAYGFGIFKKSSGMHSKLVNGIIKDMDGVYQYLDGLKDKEKSRSYKVLHSIEPTRVNSGAVQIKYDLPSQTQVKKEILTQFFPKVLAGIILEYTEEPAVENAKKGLK